MGNQRIKVIHILPSLSIGGREKIVLEIINRLDRRKFDVFVCSLMGGKDLFEKFKETCREVKCLNMNAGIDFRLIINLKNYFEDKRPDIVHIHSPGPLTYGVISAILAKVPVVVNTEHGFAFKERFRKRVADHTFRNFVDMNICVSKKLNNELNKFVVNKKKIITMFNGTVIPSEKFISLDSIVSTRKKLGFSPSDIIIVNIARLAKVKNHHMLLDSMQNVIDTIPNAKLLIVGDGTLRDELEGFSKRLGVSNNVIFWGKTDYVGDVLRIMDIFVLSSLNEGMSLTILEAMAHGKPVVATDVGGNPEIVDNGNTGILVPPQNPKEMAKAILHLLTNPQKAKKMGIEGRKRVETLFNIEILLEKTEKLYLNLLHNSNL